ncbi:HNH endonuclease [Limosilactobacillus vaginalis]|uniref:HNH endonuclease n=1 Tax=Limosilactobacillus vaginalis TaxID=1633 RepID=UPI0036221AAD
MGHTYITSEEFVEDNKRLHLMHIKYGYPKGKRPKISKAKRRRIYERDKGICAYCGKYLPFDSFHIDHIIPLAKGGNNEDDNLTVLCPRCNRKKHDQIIKLKYVRGEKNGSLGKKHC